MTKVFIDGSAGTTGLRIRERLAERKELELLILPEELRKNNEAIKAALKAADIAFLCLPDAAAKEAVLMAQNEQTVIIDTSTAHRTAPGWTYGFPELVGKQAIAQSKRIANPGCHASGFIALVKPLTDAGLIKPSASLSCFSVTGYSGGGKSMIAEYEDENRSPLLKAPRQYGLTQAHKHLAEMQMLCGLEQQPIFSPIVADFYSGMEVCVPLFAKDLTGTPEDIRAVYRRVYRQGLVHFAEQTDEGAFLSANAFAFRDDMEITLNGNEERLILTARFDNLGKGASGAAIQNMNLVLGVEETRGLHV